MVGDGANLGMTQLARIDFNHRGGRLNTDAIDNSAGVNMSDYEVNLKILLEKMQKLKKITSINKRGKETKNKSVFSSFRKGEVIGDHEITFMSQNETIKISHKAMNRGIFVDGAIQAVKWGHNQEPGLYSMSDVLGLN